MQRILATKAPVASAVKGASASWSASAAFYGGGRRALPLRVPARAPLPSPWQKHFLRPGCWRKGTTRERRCSPAHVRQRAALRWRPPARAVVGGAGNWGGGTSLSSLFRNKRLTHLPPTRRRLVGGGQSSVAAPLWFGVTSHAFSPAGG